MKLNKLKKKACGKVFSHWQNTFREVYSHSVLDRKFHVLGTTTMKAVSHFIPNNIRRQWLTKKSPSLMSIDDMINITCSLALNSGFLPFLLLSCEVGLHNCSLGLSSGGLGNTIVLEPTVFWNPVRVGYIIPYLCHCSKGS